MKRAASPTLTFDHGTVGHPGLTVTCVRPPRFDFGFFALLPLGLVFLTVPFGVLLEGGRPWSNRFGFLFPLFIGLLVTFGALYCLRRAWRGVSLRYRVESAGDRVAFYQDGRLVDTLERQAIERLYITHRSNNGIRTAVELTVRCGGRDFKLFDLDEIAEYSGDGDDVFLQQVAAWLNAHGEPPVAVGAGRGRKG